MTPSDRPNSPQWWVVSGESLRAMLQRTASGEDVNLVYTEEYANAVHPLPPFERPNPIVPVGSPAPAWLRVVAAVYVVCAFVCLAVFAYRLVAQT